MSDQYSTTVKITIESDENHGGKTLQTAITRLLEANRIPYLAAEQSPGVRVLTVGTFPGIQHILAYAFPENELTPEECHDEAGGFRDPR